MVFSLELLIGVLAVIAAITVPLIIYFLQKSKKRLTYEVISDTQLVGIKSEVQNKIKIYYEDKLVENVHLISIKIINNGNQPISISDFAELINIRLGNNTNILTCEVLEQNPKDLDVCVVKIQDSIEIQPLLLNPNDSFTLNILLSNYKRDLEVSARIEGVNKIEYYVEPQPIANLIMLIIFILLIILNIFYVIFKSNFESFFGIDSEKLALILISPILIFSIYGILITSYEAIRFFFLEKLNRK